MGSHVCVKCGKNREGNFYTFYCGVRTGKYTDYTNGKKYTKYQIDQILSPFICEKCNQSKVINLKIFHAFFFALYSVVILAFTFLFSRGFSIWWILLIGMLLSALPWLFYPHIIRGLKWPAATKIIRTKYAKPFSVIARHKYKNDWDVILNPKEYEEINKHQTWTSKRESTEVKLFLFIIFIFAFIAVVVVFR